MQICITMPEESCFRPEISNLNEMVSNSKVLSSIKSTKARSTESPDILKNPQRTVWVLKNSLSVGKQSTDITWTHPTTNPHSCNVKLKWPGATTKAKDACCCCWSCPKLLQCDWHMYVQQLKTASQQMSTVILHRHSHAQLTLLRIAELHSSHEACIAVVCNLPRSQMRHGGHAVSMQIWGAQNRWDTREVCQAQLPRRIGIEQRGGHAGGDKVHATCALQSINYTAWPMTSLSASMKGAADNMQNISKEAGCNTSGRRLV